MALMVHLGETAPKKARIDPDAPATEPASKQMRISTVHHFIEVVGKDGTKIDVEVNAEEGELDQEMRLAETLLWESEFPPEAEKRKE